MTSMDFTSILPELGLAVFAMLALLVGAFRKHDEAGRPILWATVIAMIGMALFIALRDQPEQVEVFGGLILHDAFSRYAQVVLLASGALVLAMSANYMSRWGFLKFEYPILVALASVGMMLMVSANNLLMLYLGLELQSLALYVMAAMRRDSARSAEAGLKYFVLGSLSSGLLLYGAALVYGFAGTTGFAGISTAIAGGDMGLGLLFGLVFLLVGLAFKVSAAPFHMWTPDVYEGAPTPVTAFFATAPKVAAMALLARLLLGAFGSVPGDWGQILGALAILSMIVGAVAGIGQRNIKRLMAYSSIAHMGFALLGLAAGTPLGVKAMLTYMVIYSIMSIGLFAFIMSMERDGQPVTDLDSLNQFAKAQPLKAFGLLVLLFSLAGVPPFLGFFAKFGVLMAALDAGYVWLATLGMVSFVIGSFYYLRIVYYMYFGAETEPLTSHMSPVAGLLMLASVLALIIGSVSMVGIDDAAGRAADALFATTPIGADTAMADLD